MHRVRIHHGSQLTPNAGVGSRAYLGSQTVNNDLVDAVLNGQSSAAMSVLCGRLSDWRRTTSTHTHIHERRFPRPGPCPVLDHPCRYHQLRSLKE